MKRELRTTLELGAGAAIVAILTLLYILGVARFLGPAQYADFAAAMSLFYFIAVALSPLGPTIARVVARYAARGEIHRVGAIAATMQRRAVRWAAIAVIPFALAAIPFSRVFHFRSPVPIILALLSAALFTIVSIQRGVLQGIGAFREYNVNTILEAVLRLAGAAAILMVLPDPVAALAAYLGALVVATLTLKKMPASSTDDDAEGWGAVRKLVTPMFIAMIAIAVFQNADVLIVKRWFTATEAGQFSAASTLARAISVLFVPVYTLAGPMMTTLWERGESLVPATLRLCGYFAAMAVIPTAIFAIAGERVIAVMYGAAFAPAGGLLWKLAALATVTYLSLLVAQALITTGDPRFRVAYAGFTILHVVVLLVSRRSIELLVMAQFAVQGTLLAVVLIVMMSGTRRSARC